MDELVCMEHSYIVVEDGRVAGVFRTLPEKAAATCSDSAGLPVNPGAS